MIYNISHLWLVSIHAPARGATWAITGNLGGGSFNSRARKGRDKETEDNAMFRESFNSRARKGRDPRSYGTG